MSIQLSSSGSSTPGTPEPQDLSAYCTERAQEARKAARVLAGIGGAQKNRWLERSASALQERASEIFAANEVDVQQAQDRLAEGTMTSAQVDRLRLTPERLKQTADGLRQIASLADPVGQIRDTTVRPNGLEIHKVGVPLGVILFIYESRPNVTVDAAGLCVKSGNAVILRGGREALTSNQALHRVLQDTLSECQLPTAAVQLVSTPEREAVGHLLRLGECINLVIPRGGEGLIRRVAAEASMPVLKHYKGNCHVYVEKSADLEQGRRIVINGKCQRPGVCNAVESLLVDAAVSATLLPVLGKALREQGVEVRGCPETCRYVPEAKPATEEDYDEEYLDLILSVKVVAGMDEALEHIHRHGSGHTDAIVTESLGAAREFTRRVDSACVMVNASPRFHDGYEMGLGAEIGISTDKFHARGPCGLLELTSYKYLVYGNGQTK